MKFCLTERMGLETTMEQSWSGRVEKAVSFGGVPIEETMSSVHTGCIVRTHSRDIRNRVQTPLLK